LPEDLSRLPEEGTSDRTLPDQQLSGSAERNDASAFFLDEFAACAAEELFDEGC
jgi:hypothetical protein